MMKNILVEELCYTPTEKKDVEIVERKGIGHPDSIADGIAESVSRSLSRLYLERFGRILHHNTDECQIVGGQSQPRFGGGMILEPVQVILVGRAVTQVNGERIPHRTVAVKAAKDYLRSVCNHLDMESDVVFDCKISQGSVDLRGVFDTGKLLANDTSFGVSFAPFTETERITLRTEQLINGKLKKTLPEVGEDVKVMCMRNKDKITMTIAAAMVDSEIDDKSHYLNVKEELKEKALDCAVKLTKRDVEVFVNTADNPKTGIYYLTVTGLSMENGDDGSVGRGNRVNGLITPYRPMSMEASAGKNPVTHTGKLYNILANKIAHEIADRSGGDAEEVLVRILSQIGKPIDQPQVASVQIIPANGASMPRLKKLATEITDSWLNKVYEIKNWIADPKKASEITVF